MGTIGSVVALFDFGISLSVWPWIWLLTAVVLALVELFAVPGSFLILPWAISAFIASFMGFGGIDAEWQWAMFVFGGLIIFIGMYRWARGFMDNHETPIGIGADRLLGQRGTVSVAIEPLDPQRLGKVILDGELWGALSDNDQPIPAGAEVVVKSVKGTRVVVERVTATPDGPPAPPVAPPAH